MSKEVDRTRRSFVSYIDKSREYYAAHGYQRPYQWAYHDEVPFQSLARPVAESRVAVVTTSSLYAEDRPASWPESQSKRAFALEVERLPERMDTDGLAWDRNATHTDDRESFLPVDGLRELETRQRIGSLAPRIYGAPTDYSQRRTLEVDGPRIVEWAKEDAVDLALLVPL